VRSAVQNTGSQRVTVDPWLASPSGDGLLAS
jgi:hypothetical protein